MLLLGKLRSRKDHDYFKSL